MDLEERVTRIEDLESIKQLKLVRMLMILVRTSMLRNILLIRFKRVNQ